MRTRIIHAIPATLLGAMAALAAAPEQSRRAQTMSLIDANQKPAVVKSLGTWDRRGLYGIGEADPGLETALTVRLLVNESGIRPKAPRRRADSTA